jgi:hypothetical protein
LRFQHPDGTVDRRALTAFVEPRFLHQTREAGATRPHAADDPDEALGLVAGHPLPARAPWRIHLHIRGELTGLGLCLKELTA